MRQYSFSVRSVATAVINSSMSTSRRPRYRGGRGLVRGRWQRNYSERPFGDNNNQFVTGDSHFQSVRDTNLGVQRGSGNNSYLGGSNNFANFVYNSGFQPQPYAPRPRSRPPFNPRLQFNLNQPPPFTQPLPFHVNQQLHQHQQQQPPLRRRKPKPADYREWEYAKSQPPPECEHFVVLSYNILADYLANSHRKLYFHIPSHILNWEWRKRSIVFELGLWSPDIMCFQEVDKFRDLEEALKLRGYVGIWKMRTGTPTDGCAMFWRESRFKLVHEECIEFNKLGLRDNVAQICVLESLIQNDTGTQPVVSMSSEGSNRVVICNIHVLYNPKRGEIKLGQVRVLLDRAQAVSKIWSDAPVVICGDFNCVPKSPLYNFISEQKLDLSELDRDKISGQASAEICVLPKQYDPRPGIQSIGNIVPTTSFVENRGVDSRQSGSPCNANKERNPQNILENTVAAPQKVDDMGVDSHQNNSFSDIQKQSNSEIISENMPPVNSLEQPHYYDSSLDVSDGSCNVESCSTTLCDRDTVNINLASAVRGEENMSSSISEIELGDTTSNQNFRSCVPYSQSHISVENRGMCCKIDVFSSAACDWSNKEDASLTLNIDVDEKLKDLSLGELDGTHINCEDLGEDSEDFLSKLHSCEGNEILDDLTLSMDSESEDVKKTGYDPSQWTPMEIATATGDKDRTFLEHPLKLKSTYAEVEDCSGTRDSNGEPLVTSYNRCFLGTVDYIWQSEGVQTVRVLAPIPKDAMQWTPGFPTKKWGSDHIALAAELAITKQV
ncbi:hypothetical protein Ancab_022722 [Ancistrocladus abbreviatus]